VFVKTIAFAFWLFTLKGQGVISLTDPGALLLFSYIKGPLLINFRTLASSLLEPPTKKSIGFEFYFYHFCLWTMKGWEHWFPLFLRSGPGCVNKYSLVNNSNNTRSILKCNRGTSCVINFTVSFYFGLRLIY